MGGFLERGTNQKRKCSIVGPAEHPQEKKANLLFAFLSSADGRPQTPIPAR
jgi:hypothetical protein